MIERLGKLRILQVSGATVNNGWLVSSSFALASSDRPTFDIISTCYCIVGTTRTTGYVNVSSSGLTAARDGSNTAFTGSIFFSVAWTV